MKKNRIKAGLLAVVFLVMQSWLFTGVSAVEDSSGCTRFLTSYNHDCYADITIEGNHFTIDGRVAIDPATKVKFSTDDVVMYDYQFTEGDDRTFHAEFDAEFSGDWCELWIVKESRLVLNYRIHNDKNGWYFPSNGLAELNAEKLDNILTAPPEAAAYYISETADPVEIEETLAELEGIVQEVCGDEEDDYMKALLLYRWVSDNFYYDKDASETGVTLDTVAIHNVLERKRTTCAGFSNTYCALLEIAGIRSVNLKGSSVAGEVTYEELPTAGENHEFTAFWYEAESRWVYADPTWGRSGMYENGEYLPRNYPSTERYFDETGEAFSLKHRIDKVEERSYLGVLDDPEETTEETTAEPTDSEVSQTAEKSETTTTPRSTSAPQSNEPSQNGNFVIYIVIGAAGVVIVITGIILVVSKKR